MSKYFIGRGLLHPEKLKIAEKLRGKPLVDREGSTCHCGVAEIRLCAYMYYCYINDMMGYSKMYDYEYPIRESWKKDGILKDQSYVVFTKKGKKFCEYVLKWAYPEDYQAMVIRGGY